MKKSISQQMIVIVVFAAMFLGFSIFLQGFFTGDNLLTLLQNVAILGILGLGMALVVIGRSIDISLVALMAIPSGLVLEMVQNGHSVGAAVAGAAVLVLIFGLVNGWLTAYAEVPALYTTLASGVFLAGMGQSFLFKIDVVQWSPELEIFGWVGRGNVAGVPMAVIMFGLVALVIGAFLRFTGLGAYIYAIGDNPAGARTTGIPVRPVIMLQFVMAAFIAAFGGMIMAVSISSMPTRIYNSTLIYDVILVVVLGGIGLSGGRGGVTSVIIGTLLIGTMLNAMTIMDVSYSVQNMVKGLVLLVAILLDSFINPRNEETAQQGDI